MQASPRSQLLLVAMVVAAVPMTWGVETALRLWCFPADFEELRVTLRPTMSAVARGLVVVTLLLVWPTRSLMRWLVRRRLRALPGQRPDLRSGVRLVAFLAASSLLQLPGVLATLLSMCGANVRAVAAVVVTGTLGLLGLSWITLRDCAREGSLWPEKSLDDSGTAP